jgi:hypothetical protein
MNRTEAVHARRAKAEVWSLRVPSIRTYQVPEFGSSVLTEFRSGCWMPGLTIFSCALLIDPRSGHPAVRPASGCSARLAMPCSSLSHRQSPAGPASQPPALRKLLAGGWEVKNWRWDREEQKTEKQEIKSERGDGCCS